MSGQLQLRRGSTIENDAFTGVIGELTYDTEKKGLRIHDGVTQGGFEVPVLVAVQRPTAENNYTWYRKWSDGWVEQGGIILNEGSDADRIISFPIQMLDTNYTLVGGLHNRSDGYAWHSHISVGWDKTTTGFTTSVDILAESQGKDWQVSGMAA